MSSTILNSAMSTESKARNDAPQCTSPTVARTIVKCVGRVGYYCLAAIALSPLLPAIALMYFAKSLHESCFEEGEDPLVG